VLFRSTSADISAGVVLPGYTGARFSIGQSQKLRWQASRKDHEFHLFFYATMTSPVFGRVVSSSYPMRM
jgi:hypothetical protein